MIDALFPYSRSIGRGEYAVRLLACLAVSVPVLLWRWQVVRAGQAGQALLFLAVLILVLLLIQAQVIGRLRNVDASVLLSGLVFIPYLNAAFALALLVPPTRVPARSGAGPAGPSA